MKKHLLLLSLSLLVLAGCQEVAEPEATGSEVKNELKVETKAGVIEVLNDPYLSATHILAMSDGARLLVRSGLVNLKMYEKRAVLAEGRVMEDNVFEIENVTRTGNEDAEKVEYKNEEFGFSIQYPKIWLVAESSSSGRGMNCLEDCKRIDFSPYDGSDVVVSTYRLANADKRTLQKFAADFRMLQFGSVFDQLEACVESKIGYDQLSALKCLGGGIDPPLYFFIQADKWIHVLEFSNTEDVKNYENTFFDMVNSFKLLSSPVAVTEPVKIPVTKKEDPKPEVKPEEPKAPPVAQQPKPEEPKPVPPAPTPTPTPQPQPSNGLEEQKAVVAYLSASINALAPEASATGTWTLISLELVKNAEGVPIAAYANYGDSQVRKRLLLKIDPQDPTLVTQLGYFTQGAVKDWDLVSGANTYGTSAKTYIGISSDPQKNTTVDVKEGYRLMTATRFKVQLQYPANWYYASINGGYGFGPQAIDETEDIAIFLQSGGLSVDGEHYAACKQIEVQLCLVGKKDQKATIDTMLDTMAKM